MTYVNAATGDRLRDVSNVMSTLVPVELPVRKRETDEKTSDGSPTHLDGNTDMSWQLRCS